VRRGLAVPAGIGLLLLAFGIAYTAPDDERAQAPFATRGTVGEELVARHHVATVHEVSLADRVEIDDWQGTTSGVWLVVDATLAARVETVTVVSSVFVGGVRYAGSSRPGIDTLDGRVADAGFPLRGAMLVELPRDILDVPAARAAVLRISGGGDARLDGVIELVLDLTTLEHVDRVQLSAPEAAG